MYSLRVYYFVAILAFKWNFEFVTSGEFALSLYRRTTHQKFGKFRENNKLSKNVLLDSNLKNGGVYIEKEIFNNVIGCGDGIWAAFNCFCR